MTRIRDNRHLMRTNRLNQGQKTGITVTRLGKWIAFDVEFNPIRQPRGNLINVARTNMTAIGSGMNSDPTRARVDNAARRVKYRRLRATS